MPPVATAARRTKPRTKPTRKSASSSSAGEVLIIAAATQIHVDRIIVRDNQRKTFDPESLQQLEADIRRQGVLQPLVVRAIPDDPGRVELIAGERRLRAALMAGLQSVPVVERDCADDGDRLLAQFAENELREDLNPIERAAAIDAIMQSKGWKQKQAAEELGLSQGEISNQLRLLTLPENPWQQWVAAGKLAATAVRPLCAWTNRPQVLQYLVDKYATEIDEGNFTLREEILHNAIRHCSRPTRWENAANLIHYYAPKSTDCHFRIKADDPDEVKALDIQAIDFGYATKEERCWNIEEFDHRNEKPLKKLRKQHKEAKEKRAASETWSTPESRKAAGKGEAKEPTIPNLFDFHRALTVQLRSEMAGSLQLGTDQVGLQKVLLYLASQETACDMPAVLEKETGSSASADVLKLILKTPDKDWTDLLYVIVRGVLAGEGQNGSFLSEGLSEPDEVVSLAQIVDIDLLATFQPDRAVLELMSESYLRQIGTEQLGLPRDQQPDTLEEVLDWLQVDWPEGWLCPEMEAALLGVGKRVDA